MNGSFYHSEVYRTWDSVTKSQSQMREMNEMKCLLHMEIYAVIINEKVYTGHKLTSKFIDYTREANLIVLYIHFRKVLNFCFYTA